MLKDQNFHKKPELSIIIVNYNLAKEIENCLNSLLVKIGSIEQIEYEIIIVDNNSPDKALPEVEKNYGKNNIHFYYLDENGGFGKGCNFGYSKASGEYICFLNPDTIIEEDVFTPILKLFKENASVGIIGPKQLTKWNLFDYSAGFYPNIFFQLFHTIGIGVFFEGFLTHLLTILNKKDYYNVGWILGAAIFIRSELFKMVNGFDKDYFMFSEEVDLCRRISREGFRVVYYSGYKIRHIGSVSGKKNYSLFTIRTYISKNIYFSKHYHLAEKLILKSLLRIELFFQIIIWSILYPLNKQKSVQKIKAFIFLIKNDLENKPY